MKKLPIIAGYTIYLLPFLADFLEAFFEGMGFFCAALALDPLSLKAVSHPSAYFWLVPTRVIVTSGTSLVRTSPRIGSNARPVATVSPLNLTNEIRFSGQAA